MARKKTKSTRKQPIKKPTSSSTSKKRTDKRLNRKSPSLKSEKDRLALKNSECHVYGQENPKICATSDRGYRTPQNRSPLDIVVDASDGFIPLWGENTCLKWRFNEPSMDYFQSPDLAKDYIRELFGTAMLEWGDSVPVEFDETSDNWDFEFTMMGVDDCAGGGCTLARAFFPDAGQHDLALYPFLFEQSEQEQIETMIHEFGHVFGLRHFFAQIDETDWDSEIFGTHDPFSIMNYGDKSVLTDADKSDLKLLYEEVWSGDRTEINGTPVVLVRPYHELRNVAGQDLNTASLVVTGTCNNSTERAMRKLLIEILGKE